MTAHRRLNVGLEQVREVYAGPGGLLWEVLMGEQIHVGGAEATATLARQAGITASSVVLDVCSALGGPARQLAATTGCAVVGLDGTFRMHDEARRRTRAAGLEPKVRFELGDALDMPFDDETFDVVWGQDAWCYVTDKETLLGECARVVKPGGVVAFTDWIETGPMTDEVWTARTRSWCSRTWRRSRATRRWPSRRGWWSRSARTSAPTSRRTCSPISTP